MNPMWYRFHAVLAVVCAVAACAPTPDATDEFLDGYTGWWRYEGDAGATSFSPLDQINRSNVNRLEVAWIYESDAPGLSAYNPIVVDSFMYVLGDDATIVALHAGAGHELWTHVSDVPGGVRAHGLMYWESTDRSDRRVFYQKGSFHTIAVNALTGETISSFGENGVLDLRPGMGIDPSLVTGATSPTPGVIFQNLMILGSGVGEGYVAAPGHIRAYDVRTGERVWIFHTLPQPGEYGYDTWPPGRTDNENVGNPEHASGGANVWGGMSVDLERGIVYAPLGAVNYDFYGVDRPGKNLFGNSLVALDARTGELIWYFQTVHHDLWDYDLTATPVLLSVRHEGRQVDVVVLATKTGFVFVFDRVTGEPLWPIEDRPVPPSDMPGEEAWPTQPFPTWPEPFVPIEFSLEDDLNPYLKESERDSIMEAVRNMRYEGIFTPPSTQPTLQMPGNRGGANFGATAGDPRDGTFFVLAYNMPSVLQLLPITAGATGTGASPFDQGQAVYQMHCQICHGETLAGHPASGIPSLIGITDRLSHDEYQAVIRSGIGTMPGFPQLSPQELTMLHMFLANPDLALTTGTNGGTPDVPEPAGPVRYQSGWIHILDSDGLPVIKPPWFRMTAYDLNTGEIKWQVPVGEVKHLAEQGIRDTGAAYWLRGGPALTAGGLLFQGAVDQLVAYDLEDGSEIWSVNVPGMIVGIPSIYEVAGRQYVAISVSEGFVYANQVPVESPTPGYMVFALPETISSGP